MTSSTPHLPDNRVLLPDSHNDDAVGLTDAPLCPRRQCVISLVENYAMEVFLLAQPAGQTVLMDAEEEKESINAPGGIACWQHIDQYCCCANKAHLNTI